MDLLKQRENELALLLGTHPDGTVEDAISMAQAAPKQVPAQPVAPEQIRQQIMQRMGRPSGAEATYQKLMALQNKNFEERRAGADALEKQASQLLKQQGPKDLTNLLGGLSFFAGQDLTRGYKAPKDQSGRAFQLQQMAAAQRAGISKDELNMLKQKLGFEMKQGGSGISPLTPLEEAKDKAYGKEQSEFLAAGGYADAEKGLDQIRDAIDALSSGKAETGGTIYSLTPGFMDQYVGFSDEKNVQSAVEEVVQRNLRKVLGAQFTEKEGSRLIERAFDPKADSSENLKRLSRLARQMRKAMEVRKAADAWVDRHGSLKGYTGPLVNSINSADQFDLDSNDGDLNFGGQRASGGRGKVPLKLKSARAKALQKELGL